MSGVVRLASSAGKLVRTVRCLRPSQIAWRIVHEAQLRAHRRGLALCRTVAPPDARMAVAAPSPPRRAGCEAMVANRWVEGEVEYLGQAGDRDDWSGEDRPRLWRYEHHYHSEIVAFAFLAGADPGKPWAEHARRLVRSWARACPPPRGDGWEPYPVARRVLNWSLAGYLSAEIGAEVAPLVAQGTAFLARHVERHLLGNHLLCDAAALMAGGSAVEASGSDRLATQGQRLLMRELERQVLPDGGYAERTVQYHAIVLRDALLAAGLWQARGWSPDVRLLSKLGRMASWLAAVSASGRLPFLNDAAPDATPAAEEVLSLARAVGVIDGPWAHPLGAAFGGAPAPEQDGAASLADLELPDTGWSFVREGRHEVLFEHGPVGPDEQPGHGHSDALSFELVWDGAPVVTDSGITTYDRGPVRDFERSGRAHATLTVGGEGPEEMWAAFRVGGRSRVEGGLAERRAGGVRVLRGSVRSWRGWEHRRVLVAWPGRALIVLDRVKGSQGAAVQSHLPLDPCCRIEGKVIQTPSGSLVLDVLQGEVARTDAGNTHPRHGWCGSGFGRPLPRQSITIDATRDGEVAYALAAPCCAVSVGGGVCTLEAPGAGVRIEFGHLL